MHLVSRQSVQVKDLSNPTRIQMVQSICHFLSGLCGMYNVYSAVCVCVCVRVCVSASVRETHIHIELFMV